ncbi:MAG: polysaccharide deacetylase family protein [Candidatus Rokubacteria bacterium]|nr:polysaccharide deacetylase family protein [Candidatus Rokubacteria bacterium]
MSYRRYPAFPILVYHRVDDNRDPFFPSVPTEVFERQMRFVARTYRVLILEELVERMRSGGLPRNALAITFDDGYRDVLTHVAPILTKYRAPASVFLATGFIGTAEVPWFDRLAMAFKLTKATFIATPWGETMSLASDGDRVRGLQRTLDALKRLQDEELRRTVDGLLESLGVTEQRNFKGLMLGWDDVHALMGLGFAIGAHTVNHPILSRVSLERVRSEIEGSRAMIESACGHRPRAFAYPNGQSGDYTAAVVRLVREAGFTCAVSARFGINTRRTSPWELRRGQPWEHDVPTFALKLAWYRMAL